MTPAATDLARRVARGGFEALARVDAATNWSRHYPEGASAILAYHAVGDPEHYGDVSAERLRRDIEHLAADFGIADLPGVLEPGGQRVALTFDDAYESFADNALPVLREYGVPATLFVPVDFVGGGDESLAYRFVRSPSDRESFNDPAAFAGETVPDPGVLSWDRLREVAADPLVTVGTHTRTHPDLARVTDRETLRDEIVGARDELERRLGVDVDRFCFPFGRHSAAAVEVVRESHALGVTSRRGVLFDPEAADRILLPRVRAHEPEHRVRWDLSALRWRLTGALG